MKTVVLLSLSLAVALGTPVLPPDVVQHPDEAQSPLLGDQVPVQGHVVVENPAPQISPSSNKKQQTPEDVKLKENMAEEKPEDKAEPEVKVEKTEPEMEKELQFEPDFKVESEVKEEEEEFNMVEKEVKVKPEVEELEPDFKVDSEVKVEPDSQTEEEPEELHDADPDMMVNDADTKRKHEPVMESEPLSDDDDDDDDDDDNLVEEEENQKEVSDEEMSFRQEDYVAEPLPEEEEEEEEDLVEEEEEFLRKRDVLDEQPVMEVEPEMMEEAEPNLVEDEAPLMEQLSESYLPDKEAQMKMFVREEPEEDEDQLDERQQALIRVNRQATGGRRCPGMLAHGKCYQFFKAPKNYADAEFFCQEQFYGGHLASITSPSTHREVMNLILMQNGAYTRTWVGGRRLDDHRFVWLDGSRWTYDDWLSGEPNNTAGVEDCVEVLAFGNGKFNDFTCWEPQPFICSYPYQ